MNGDYDDWEHYTERFNPGGCVAALFLGVVFWAVVVLVVMWWR